MTLRLVHPAREGQATRPPKGRRSAALHLTAEEVRHLRAATTNAVRAFGSSGALAAAIGVPRNTVHTVTAPKGRRPTAIFAVRLAKVAGLSVEAVLGPALNEAGRCNACGSRVGAGKAAS